MTERRGIAIAALVGVVLAGLAGGTLLAWTVPLPTRPATSAGGDVSRTRAPATSADDTVPKDVVPVPPSTLSPSSGGIHLADGVIPEATPGDEAAAAARKQAIAAQADLLAHSKGVDAICPVSVPIDASEARLIVDGDSADRAGNGVAVQILDGKAFLAVPGKPSGDATLHVDGYVPVHVHWGPGDAAQGGPGGCGAPIALQPGEASVSGTVANGAGLAEGRAWVEGCGGRGGVDADGGFYLDAVPGDCQLRAFRDDGGGFAARSEPVDVHVVAGGEQEVALALPPEPRAGLGVNIKATADGMLVKGLLAGGPAETAGLRAGDVVTSIDGQPTAGMTEDEFIDLGSGPVGSDVTLVARDSTDPDAQPRTLVVHRQTVR